MFDKVKNRFDGKTFVQVFLLVLLPEAEKLSKG